MDFSNLNKCPICGAPLWKRINIKDLQSGEVTRKYEYACKSVFRRIIKGPRKEPDYLEYTVECPNDTEPKQAYEDRCNLIEAMIMLAKSYGVDQHFRDKVLRVMQDLNPMNELLKSVRRRYKTDTK